MKKGFFSGTFDPITIGHVNVIERAARLCDHLTVGVMDNYEKTPMFTSIQRLEMAKAALSHIPNVDVVAFSGHLASYVLDHGYDVSIRGIRNSKDAEYEIELAQIYSKFYNNRCETVYLLTDERYSYISSSVVRANFALDADVSAWVSPKVLELMNQYKNRG